MFFLILRFSLPFKIIGSLNIIHVFSCCLKSISLVRTLSTARNWLGMAFTRHCVCSPSRPPCCFSGLSRTKILPPLPLVSFNLVKLHGYFFISSEIPNLWFIASLEAFYLYNNLGFQTVINSQSKNICIFYLLFETEGNPQKQLPTPTTPMTYSDSGKYTQKSRNTAA